MYAHEPLWESAIARRRLNLASTAAPFAMAAQPVSSQVITTDTTGLDAGPITISTSLDSIPGYYAKPKGSGPFPVILVMQEIFGVHEHL